MRKLRASNKGDGMPYLGRVIYERNDQMSIIERQLEETLKPLIGTKVVIKHLEMEVAEVIASGCAAESVERTFEERKVQATERYLAEISPPIREAVQHLLGVRAFLKFPGLFSQEQEWRLVSMERLDCPDLFLERLAGCSYRVCYSSLANQCQSPVSA